MNIFQQAAAGLNLTPGQRAFLKLTQSFVNAGIAAVLLALPMWLSAQDGKPLLTWTGAGVIAGVFVHGFMTAWQKYVSAKGDQPLAGAIEQRYGVPAAAGVVVEPDVPSDPAVSDAGASADSPAR